MKLAEYAQKRDFSKTPEPKPKNILPASLPVFVIQKHWATTLHYDFRLEISGVLKSWAVPKVPSLDPTIKRLAIMTEDHPLNYRNFEGTIPQGNYGAGRVEIWDYGNFLPASGNVKDLLSGLKEGHLTIILNGMRLKGEFALIKLKNKTEKNWLLIKIEDEYAQKNQY